MHVLINGAFWSQPTVGSGQYLHALLRWLPRIAPHHRYTLLLPVSSGTIPTPPASVATLTLRTPFDDSNKNLAKLWFEQIGIPHITRILTAHTSNVVLHVPYFAPPRHTTVPLITTIPDIIPLVLPAYRGGLQVRAYMHLVRHSARHANHIITFSQHSMHDIATHLHIAPERITTTMLAADERYIPATNRAAAQQEVATRYHIQSPYIYYVGGLDVRKNVPLLLDAMRYLKARAATTAATVPTLVIAGQPFSTNRHLFPDVDRLIEQYNIGDVVKRIEVPYADGALLYQASSVFVFPSRYEGFGLPPLEAMACGVPVVCSNTTSLPEVVGNAAITILPDDANAWATHINMVLYNNALYTMMQHRSLTQAARFSWRRVAEETLCIYETKKPHVMPCCSEYNVG